MECIGHTAPAESRKLCWLSYREAICRLTHPQSREILRAAEMLRTDQQSD
jgi:hypothetical protein